MEKIQTSAVINEILIDLEKNELIDYKKIELIKMILDINLSSYQIYKTECTALSTDLDTAHYLLEQYLISLRLKGCTTRTIEQYAFDLKQFINYINMSIRDVKYFDIQRYLAYGKLQRKWKDNTYNNKLRKVRGFFLFLFEEDFISDNPGKRLKETKVEYKIGPVLNAYKREEVKCACLSERELAFCEFLYSTGIRISELCALNIDDIDFINKTAVVYGKGRKEREVYFTDQAKLHLERYLKSRKDSNPALFVTDVKPYRRMTACGLRYMLNRIKLRDPDIANITLTPHVFRRSVATDMLTKGAPIEIIAEKLGHSSISTTRSNYIALNKTVVKQAHEKYVS